MKKITKTINNEEMNFIIDGKDIYVDLGLVKDFIEKGIAQVNSTQMNYTVVIDAGHGGKDAGAVDEIDKEKNDYIRTLEKDLNLKITLLVSEKLQSLGFTVILTRDTDVFVELYNRTKMANKTDAILFLSIHFNASTSQANGIETFKYTNTKNPLSHAFAKNLQSEMLKASGFKDRGVKEAGFWVLKHTKMAAALVELGFITNNEEEKKINSKEFQDKISNAIVKAFKQTLK